MPINCNHGSSFPRKHVIFNQWHETFLLLFNCRRSFKCLIRQIFFKVVIKLLGLLWSALNKIKKKNKNLIDKSKFLSIGS